MIPPGPGPRTRNAAATRKALLDSATRHFARESYDNVGLREVAGDAGVDPALVARYFGSKEMLFREVLRGDKEPILEGVTRETVAERFTALLLDDDSSAEPDKFDWLLILLHSSSSPRASQIVREAIDEDMVHPMVAILGGADAPLRTGMCLSVLMGVSVLRSALALEPFTRADRETLRRRLIALFAAALEDGTASEN